MLRFLLIPILWLGCVLVLYSIPGTDLDYRDPWDFLRMDKVAHVVMFGVLSHTLGVAFRKQRTFRGIGRNALSLGVLASLICGATLEIIQSTAFQNRSSDPEDLIANAIGALSGPLLFRLIYGREAFKSTDTVDRRQSTTQP